jgi:hypothetical protein
VSPREQVEQLYQQIPCVRTFAADLALHEITGYVFDLPDLFIMGRGVDRLANPHEIMDPGCLFSMEQQNCWHIYAFAGSAKRIWAVLPYPLPWACWQRARTALGETTELRFYPARRAFRTMARVSVRKNLSHNEEEETMVAASRPCWSQLTLDFYAKHRSA